MKALCTRAQPSGRLLPAAGVVLVVLQACGDGGGGSPASPTVTPNRPPAISGIACSPCESSTATAGTDVTFSVDVSDPDGDALTYSWSVTAGEIVGSDDQDVLTWRPPSEPQEVEVSVVVTDGRGGRDSFTEVVSVNRPPNRPPEIARVVCSPRCESMAVAGGREVTFFADATDPDDDPITYSWSVTGGEIRGPDDQAIMTWLTPATPGAVDVSVVVADDRGGEAVFTGVVIVGS